MIDYTVIGGFLGAGKTTLINAMLATATERLAVIVNDIGDVNIDAALIASASRLGGKTGDDRDSAEADTIELTNGCVCCSVGDSLASTLRDLCMREVPPDHIVLECSGAADPGRAARYGSRRVLADPVIVVMVDATEVRTRADDPRFVDLIDAQLGSADQLIVTKADLIGEDSIEPLIGWLTTRSSATISVGHPDQIGVVIPTERNRRPASSHDPAPTLTVETHRLGEPIEAAEIEALLSGIAGLVRAKGIVETTDGPRLVQWAAGEFSSVAWHGPMTRTGIVTIS